MSRIRFTSVFLFAFFFSWSAASGYGITFSEIMFENPSDDEQECFMCHDEVSVSGSVHEEMKCIECHDSIVISPHDDIIIAQPACVECHDEAERAFTGSVHGIVNIGSEVRAVLCKDCHGSHLILPVLEPLSLMGRFKQAVTCGTCHKSEQNDYSLSVHGKSNESGVVEAPICTDCHGRQHEIFSPSDPRSKVYAAKIANATCGICHESVRLADRFGIPAGRLRTYVDSYHGIGLEFGDLTVANCASCHGAHKILPATDTASMIHPDNLPDTCGDCHPGANENFARGKVHIMADKSTAPGVFYVRKFYTWFIGILMVLFSMHIILDFRKLIKRMRHPK